MDYHDLQRQDLSYKWMIMICRERLSGTKDDHDLQRHTLRYKQMTIICRGRPSIKNG